MIPGVISSQRSSEADDVALPGEGVGIAAGTGAATGVGARIAASAGSATATGAAAGVSGEWLVAFSTTPSVNVFGQSTLNARQHIASSVLTASGSKFRLTLTASTSTEGCHIGHMYAGHAASSGDAFDFDGTQVEVKVSTATSFLVPQGGSVVTDENIYTFDASKNFIVAMYFDSAPNDSVGAKTALTGATYYFKVTADEVATTNVTGYSNSGTTSTTRLLMKIEVWG